MLGIGFMLYVVFRSLQSMSQWRGIWIYRRFMSFCESHPVKPSKLYGRFRVQYKAAGV